MTEIDNYLELNLDLLQAQLIGLFIAINEKHCLMGKN